MLQFKIIFLNPQLSMAESNEHTKNFTPVGATWRYNKGF